MPLSNSFVKRVGKEDRYRKGWHPLIIGGLTILLSIFRAYQISDTPFLLLYHCSLNLDSLHRLRHFVHENLFSTPKSEIFGIKIFFLHENPRFCASKSFFCSKIRDSVHQNLFSAPKSEILCIKIFFLHENPRFSVSKSLLPSKLRYGKRYKKKEEDVPSRIMIHPPFSYTFYVSSTGEEYNSDKILKLSWVRKQKGISRRGF